MSNHLQEALQKNIGYHFQDKSLLVHALSHSSYANEHGGEKGDSNERLEFLGDAVLELTSSDYLFHLYDQKPEGELTKLRASLVCEPTLAFCAREIGLDKAILLGKGEELTGGRERDSIVSDAMEALIGAIYLDGGLTSAKDFIMKFVLNDIENKKLFYDSKSILQEMLQNGADNPIEYEVIWEKGPEHAKEFGVQVLVEGKVCGIGTGKTKKAAQQKAAYQAILKVRENR